MLRLLLDFINGCFAVEAAVILIFCGSLTALQPRGVYLIWRGAHFHLLLNYVANVRFHPSANIFTFHKYATLLGIVDYFLYF